VFLGAGYAARSAGLAAAAVLCALSAAVSLAPALDTSYGRTDWRGAADGLPPPGGTRVIVVTPYMSRTLWRPYLADLRDPAPEGVLVQEIAALGLATEGGYSSGRFCAAEREHPTGGGRLSDRRGRAQADVHARPLPGCPADVRPQLDADEPCAHRRAAGVVAPGGVIPVPPLASPV
jgi:hypothetical protein